MFLVAYNPGTDTTTVEGHITYDAYGNVTNTPAVDIVFGYTGRLFDEDTGLQNNLNRWYDATVGRWLSEDPIGFEGGDANLYRYVANDPGNGVDPGGLIWDWLGKLLENMDATGSPEYAPYEGCEPDLDEIQTTLDVAGMTPGVGIVPDAANTAISVGRGNFGEAGMNGLAMIPIVGQASKGSQLAAKAGKTVLGSFPDYLKLANKLNAKRFNIPPKIWAKMTDAERWAANVKFLDRMIARGDVIILSNSGHLAKRGTSFFKEIQYLKSKGYRLSEDGLRMLPPGH